MALNCRGTVRRRGRLSRVRIPGTRPHRCVNGGVAASKLPMTRKSRAMVDTETRSRVTVPNDTKTNLAARLIVPTIGGIAKPRTRLRAPMPGRQYRKSEIRSGFPCDGSPTVFVFGGRGGEFLVILGQRARPSRVSRALIVFRDGGYTLGIERPAVRSRHSTNPPLSA